MANRARSSTRDDSDRLKDALHKLRTENRKLRKEVAKFKKELTRYVDVEFERQVDLEESEVEVTVVAEAPDPKCPKCASERDYREIPAGKYLLKVCKACGYRKRLEVR